MRHTRSLVAAALLPVMAFPAAAQDWSNPGGNAQRNGRVGVVGPDEPTELWTGAPPSASSWYPLIAGRRVFVVRNYANPDELNPEGSPLVALDLDTGEELWRANLPIVREQWLTVLLGVQDGRVFAARGGDGGKSTARLHAIDAATGQVLWVSPGETTAGPWDGAVFADDGDPIIPSDFEVTRFDAETGEVLWLSIRECSYAGVCGAAVSGDGVYVVDRVPGGNAVRRFDLETGAFEVQSEVMPGFLTSSPPMIGPDGRIYVHRTGGGPDVDFLYALDDTGDSIDVRWRAEAGYASAELAIGPDGSVYGVDPGGSIMRLDPDTGAVIDRSFTVFVGSLVRMSVDLEGRLFVSWGIGDSATLASLNADLTERWRVDVPFGSAGGPALGTDGTLVMAGVGHDFRAYRGFVCRVDFDGDGALTVFDFLAFQNLFDAGDPLADLDGDGALTIFDFIQFQNLFDLGCE